MKYLMIIILILFFMGCLFNVPYGYFQFARLAFFAGFSYLAYIEYEAKRIPLVAIYIALALFLQPFAKVHFIRATWNLIDEILAAVLFAWCVIDFIFSTTKNRKHPY